VPQAFGRKSIALIKGKKGIKEQLIFHGKLTLNGKKRALRKNSRQKLDPQKGGAAGSKRREGLPECDEGQGRDGRNPRSSATISMTKRGEGSRTRGDVTQLELLSVRIEKNSERGERKLEK